MTELIATLPLPQRLALAYAPGRLRDRWLGLFALDAHLANLVRKTHEPLLGQMRLAWWRERLAEPAAQWPRGDPLLDLLAAWEGREAALGALVDGWEHLLGEALDPEAAAGFAEGRAAALAGLGGGGESIMLAGRRWALADLAANLRNPGERAVALAAARGLGPARGRLSRDLRPLTVLDGLARRALARDGAPLADGPLAALVALRLGIVGR